MYIWLNRKFPLLLLFWDFFLFWSGASVWRHRAPEDPTQPNRKTTDFSSFCYDAKLWFSPLISRSFSHKGEHINTMPLFDGLGSGGEKTAIVIDLGAAYTKWEALSR